jgi:hypothetical protein
MPDTIKFLWKDFIVSEFSWIKDKLYYDWFIENEYSDHIKDMRK